MRTRAEILADMKRAEELIKLGISTAEWAMNEKFKLLKELYSVDYEPRTEKESTPS